MGFIMSQNRRYLMSKCYTKSYRPKKMKSSQMNLKERNELYLFIHDIDYLHQKKIPKGF